MLTLPEREIGWLERFFSGRNALHWDAIVGSSTHPAWLEQVVPWIELLGHGRRDLPIILPVFEKDGPTMWYAAAPNENASASLGEELMSAIGPSYSDFRGQPHACRPDDVIESALRERFGRFIYRFSPQSESNEADIVKALSIYLGMLRQRPETPDRTQQPFGKIRGDFDKALLAGNEAAARRLLDDLLATGRANAEQQKFLEIRLLAGLGLQQELSHNDALIKSIMDLPLPPQTLTDVVDALYSRFISSIENEANVDVVLTTFKQNIGKRFGPLFKERKGVRQTSVLKAFLLYELTQEVPNATRCDAIVSAHPEGAAGKVLLQRWSSHLKSPLAQPTPVNDPNPFDIARQAVGDEDYEAAVDLYFKLLPDIRAYSGSLRCAVELSVPNITSRVLSIIDNAPTSVRGALSERDTKRIATLRSQIAAPAQANTTQEGWIAWAEAVVSDQYKTSPLAILADSVPKWSVEDYLREPAQCEKLASIIGNATGRAEEAFRDAFPNLVEFFADRPPSPVRGFAPLYVMLIEIVACNGSASADELELVSSLVHALLSTAPNKDVYAETVGTLAEIVSQNKAPSNIDWALNLAELLAIYPAPDAEARLRMFMAVVALINGNSHRLSESQKTVLQLLVKDYSCEQLLDSFPQLGSGSDVAEEHVNFSGLIGIYTLTETAGLRAMHLLQKMLPQARIELNGDFVATERLKNLAAAADVFVFAWRSSKHQAFFCVKEARKKLPIQMPLGKGTASIIAVALAAVRDT
ncbi:protein DpdD [Herbaspirillum sp.]|uniref:protein DpdD n=1 Tax=Herbaspirillum sp. TaxID=1890675 RepID=UPI0031CEA40F